MLEISDLLKKLANGDHWWVRQAMK
jgi:hypothetical protein